MATAQLHTTLVLVGGFLVFAVVLRALADRGPDPRPLNRVEWLSVAIGYGTFAASVAATSFISPSSPTAIPDAATLVIAGMVSAQAFLLAGLNRQLPLVYAFGAVSFLVAGLAVPVVLHQISSETFTSWALGATLSAAVLSTLASTLGYFAARP